MIKGLYIDISALPDFCERFDVPPAAIMEAVQTDDLVGISFETEPGRVFVRSDDLLKWFHKYQRRGLH